MGSLHVISIHIDMLVVFIFLFFFGRFFFTHKIMQITLNDYCYNVKFIIAITTFELPSEHNKSNLLCHQLNIAADIFQ